MNYICLLLTNFIVAVMKKNIYFLLIINTLCGCFTTIRLQTNQFAPSFNPVTTPNANIFIVTHSTLQTEEFMIYLKNHLKRRLEVAGIKATGFNVKYLKPADYETQLPLIQKQLVDSIQKMNPTFVLHFRSESDISIKFLTLTKIIKKWTGGVLTAQLHAPNDETKEFWQASVEIKNCHESDVITTCERLSVKIIDEWKKYKKMN
ncbi:MAG: hypothetical protein RIS64_1093 [Bacteroidota bacterium]